jgi:hypothetical protein
MNKLKTMFEKTWKYLIMALIGAFTLRYFFGSEFMDLFGLIIFGGLILIGVYGLATKKKLNDWILFAIIVVGIFGVLIDGINSFLYLKNLILGGFK